MKHPTPVVNTAASPVPTQTTLPDDPTPPIFDVGEEDLPWSQNDIIPVDDDGNVLPGEDDIDDDPNDNGDIVLDDLPDNTPDLPFETDIDPDADPRPPGAH